MAAAGEGVERSEGAKEWLVLQHHQDYNSNSTEKNFQDIQRKLQAY